MIEFAMALVDIRRVEALLADGPLIPTEIPASLAGLPVSRLQFGAEFCESLLPGEAQVRRVVDLAERRGLALSLVSPLLSDGGLDRLAPLLSLLPPGTEVVGNDWGTLRRLRDRYPGLVAVAGRLLCKMIKDPRLPSAEWARLYPHGIHSTSFGAVLDRLGVGRIEMDVPPFAAAEDFRSVGRSVSAHAPYGFSVKGRACKIGSLNLDQADKFAIGHACRRECMIYRSELQRPGSPADLATIQRGTAIFYRHAPEMAAALAEAVAAGWVDRVVVAGDWP